MSTLLVTIFGKDYDAMADLVQVYKIDVLRHTARRLEEGGYSVDAILNSPQIKSLKDNNYKVKTREDLEKVAKARSKDVSRINRYKERLDNALQKL